MHCRIRSATHPELFLLKPCVLLQSTCSSSSIVEHLSSITRSILRHQLAPRSCQSFAGMTKHPRDAGDSVPLSLSLSLALGGEGRAKKLRRRAAGDDGEFVCKTCRRAFATFQALGGHRTSHLRGRHHGGLALGLASAAPGKAEKPAAAAKAEKPAARHECGFCGAAFEMGQALGGHMRRHREEAAASAQAPPVLLQLFV